MNYFFTGTGLFFTGITLLTVWLFLKASHYSKTALYVLTAWAVLQSLACLNGFYQDINALPPRFIFLIGPAFLLIFFMFVTFSGRSFIDGMNLKWLTLLHSVRLPVEICLYLLCRAQLVPKLMTFEGANFDILSGITAPLIYYLVFVYKKAGRQLLIIWNVLCLVLLVNIVTIAILSARTPFQQLAFDQPNTGVMYFPFVLLPAVVVPLVLFSHLAALRQLLKNVKPTGRTGMRFGTSYQYLKPNT